MQTYRLYSPHSLSEIQTLFKANIKPYRIGEADTSEDAFLGRFFGNKFYFYYKKAYLHNSFSIYLCAKVTELPGGGCQLACTFRQPALLAFSLIVFMLLGSYSLNNMISNPYSFSHMLFPLLFSIGMTVYSCFFPIIPQTSKNRLLQKLMSILSA